MEKIKENQKSICYDCKHRMMFISHPEHKQNFCLKSMQHMPELFYKACNQYEHGFVSIKEKTTDNKDK